MAILPEHNNEHSLPIKCRDFLNYTWEYLFLKNGSVPRTQLLRTFVIWFIIYNYLINISRHGVINCVTVYVTQCAECTVLV